MAALEACLEWGSGQGEAGVRGKGDPEGRQLGGRARFWSPGKHWAARSRNPALCCACWGLTQASTHMSPAEAIQGWPLVPFAQ